MTQPEHYPTEAFVVRIWLERREIADAPPEWRGMIEHVTSGKRQYVRSLDSIVIFMAGYMQGWGVKPNPWAVLWQKIRHCHFRHWRKRRWDTG